MIKTEKEYLAILKRIDELLEDSTNIEDENAKGYIELNLLSDLVADYEERIHPIQMPTLSDVLRMRMAEMNINQKSLSEMLEVSTSRVSEYLNGKSEPTLKVARNICKKLKIEASLVLGV